MRVACPVDSMDQIKKNAEEAEFITLFDIEEDEILSEEKIQVSSSAIVSLILAKDVDTFICSNLDIPMMVSLSKNNIEIIGDAQGKVKTVVNSWINGTLECNDIVCSGQESGGCSGDCSHCKSI